MRNAVSAALLRLVRASTLRGGKDGEGGVGRGRGRDGEGEGGVGRRAFLLVHI